MSRKVYFNTENLDKKYSDKGNRDNKIIENKNIDTGNLYKNIKYRSMMSTSYRRFVIMIFISTIPTGVIGILLKDIIEKASETIIIPGICLLITGVLLLIADNSKKGKKTIENVTFKQAGIVGIAQGFATLPGISRSGTTITACLLCGFDKTLAVKYSFIMSIPAILGATVLELTEFDDKIFSGELIINYLVGTVVAGVVGYICIRTMLQIVKNKKFTYFAFYCFVVGIISIMYVMVSNSYAFD